MGPPGMEHSGEARRITPKGSTAHPPSWGFAHRDGASAQLDFAQTYSIRCHCTGQLATDGKNRLTRTDPNSDEGRPFTRASADAWLSMQRIRDWCDSAPHSLAINTTRTSDVWPNKKDCDSHPTGTQCRETTHGVGGKSPRDVGIRIPMRYAPTLSVSVSPDRRR